MKVTAPIRAVASDSHIPSERLPALMDRSRNHSCDSTICARSPCGTTGLELAPTVCPVRWDHRARVRLRHRRRDRSREHRWPVAGRVARHQGDRGQPARIKRTRARPWPCPQEPTKGTVGPVTRRPPPALAGRPPESRCPSGSSARWPRTPVDEIARMHPHWALREPSCGREGNYDVNPARQKLAICQFA